MSGIARPTSVVASKSTGVATAKGIETEDVITLMTTWVNILSGNAGTAIYTSSWIAPKSDVHSQQRFFYMGHSGEVRVDQAHRGYTVATDSAPFASCNPLFMKYTPEASSGTFNGQLGYGYRSFSDWVEACRAINAGLATASDFDASLPTIHTTLCATAVLEAGRRSLDSGGARVRIDYDENGAPAGFSSS